MEGYIMQVQPFSVNDGEGIRTTVFMAGCPLRCRWCSNPEGFRAEALVGWYRRKCIGCGACHAVCPQGIGINMDEIVKADGRAGNAGLSLGLRDDRAPAGRAVTGHELCIACGRCVDACPSGARSWMVSLTDAESVLRQIQKHRLFYSYSGGGVTFSGGEATMQTELLDYLSREIYDMGISMDIETCGMFDFGRVEHILARMDLIFMDLKMMDPVRHLEYTGASNERILENIANLALLGSDTDIVIRIPVIGGVNDDEENIRASAAYVHEHLPHARMELLPYHRYGSIKYEAIGMPYEHPEFTTPSKADLGRLSALVTAEGITLADYR